MEMSRPEGTIQMPENAKCVHKGPIFDVYQWEQKLYDGSVVTFERLKRQDTVSVIPILDSGKMLLSIESQPGREASWTAISGRMDVVGESPLETAKRELREETGYEANEWELWTAEQVTGKIDWVIYTFLARGLRKVGEQDLDGGEKIEVKEVDLDEFIDRVTDESFWGKHIALNVLRLLHREGRAGLQQRLSPITK